MKNAILFGNGLNRLAKGNPSWDGLLKIISKGEPNSGSQFEIGLLPPTFQYEFQYIDYEADSKKPNSESALKDELANLLKDTIRHAIYDDILKLGIDIFLTPNYDHALIGDADSWKVVGCDQSESIYSIHRWIKYKNESSNKELVVYPYHGTMDHPRTIVLGYDHYCGTLGKLDKYIKGDYSFKSGTSFKRFPSMKVRLEDPSKVMSLDSYGITELGNPELYSWADAFFMTDLHLIGFGLTFSELDVWWLLDRRIRLKKDNKELVRNKIYYYVTDPITSLNGETRQRLNLLRKYDVNVVIHQNLSELNSSFTDFEAIYTEQLNNLKKNL